MAAPSGPSRDTKVLKEQVPGDLMLSMVKGDYWKDVPDKLTGDDLKSLFKELGGDVVQVIGNISTIQTNDPHLLQGSKGGVDSKAIEETVRKLKSLSGLEKRNIIDDIVDDIEKITAQAIVDAIIWGIFSWL